MPRSWLGHLFGPALFFVERVIVYTGLGFTGPPSGQLTALALQPCLCEPGKIWQEIAGGVDEDHRE
jgi:hypothetical protein